MVPFVANAILWSNTSLILCKASFNLFVFGLPSSGPLCDDGILLQVCLPVLWLAQLGSGYWLLPGVQVRCVICRIVGHLQYFYYNEVSLLRSHPDLSRVWGFNELPVLNQSCSLTLTKDTKKKAVWSKTNQHKTLYLMLMITNWKLLNQSILAALLSWLIPVIFNAGYDHHNLHEQSELCKCNVSREMNTSMRERCQFVS